MSGSRLYLFAGLIGLLAQSLGTAGTPESANYRIERLAIAGAAAEASSTGFLNRIVVAEHGPAGFSSACNDGFVTGVGFWSIKGGLPVPIHLRVGKSAADPETVELGWTGSAQSFSVYRSQDAVSIRDPDNVTEITNECSTVDSPPAAAIFYYLIQRSEPES